MKFACTITTDLTFGWHQGIAETRVQAVVDFNFMEFSDDIDAAIPKRAIFIGVNSWISQARMLWPVAAWPSSSWAVVGLMQAFLHECGKP